MSDNRLPTEVELAFEVMPCNALRVAQEPAGEAHACAYFRQWGTYHSYDYSEDGPPPKPGIRHDSEYVGRAPLVPELLSGCRKAPIMSVGINPNLPGFWPWARNSLNPLFDNYKQFAHYFRYRAIYKLEIPDEEYEEYGGGAQDTPFSGFELRVPPDAAGRRIVPTAYQRQKMYVGYQRLLDGLAERAGWTDHKLSVGEDLAYGNMVACPSARWRVTPEPDHPTLPPMTREQRSGIVRECFRERQYFLRQLYQSLPPVLMVFSRTTSRALIGELQDRFVEGDPKPDDSLEDLMGRRVRLRYGLLPDGQSLEARVIFAPHISGAPDDFDSAMGKVVGQLFEEVQAGRLSLNPQTGHLARGKGACVFCPMLEIGVCDYEAELEPLSDAPQLLSDAPTTALVEEKRVQLTLMNEAIEDMASRPVSEVWDGVEDEAIEASEH